jgi:hypothetical protein
MVSHTGLPSRPDERVFRGDGSMEVKKVLFLFENNITKGQELAEKAKKLLLYLEGEAFDFYYDKFASGGALSEDAKDYSKVKAALMERFRKQKTKRLSSETRWSSLWLAPT